MNTKRPAGDPRAIARDVLRAVRERDAYANLVLPAMLRDARLSERDAALATELAYGACRTQGLLDAVIEAASSRPVSKIDGPLLDVLRLGTYQLLRTRIAPHAAVATSVDLARAESGRGKAGFVNAVLRKITSRSPQEWVDELAPREDAVGREAFVHAHPRWIAQAFADALGARAGELDAALAADDARPLVHLVARPGEITAEELALITASTVGRYSPYAVYLDGGDPARLDPVREGLGRSAGRRQPVGGARADPCAPRRCRRWSLARPVRRPGRQGGAARCARRNRRWARRRGRTGRAPRRLVRKACRDLPVEVHVADGRDSGLEPGYDRVLVDAPCTGLGALRRRPEARWRRRPEDVRDLVALQRQLLAAALDLVRPGGVVLYSTCSPHLSETVGVVADAVRRSGATELDTAVLLPGVPDAAVGSAAQLWPHRHGTDAMFLAALRRP